LNSQTALLVRRLQAEARAGARVILQRVPRAVHAGEVGEALVTLGLTAAVVSSPWEPTGADADVLDLRGDDVATMQSLDTRRHDLEARTTALIALLDVATGRRLAQHAPHLLSWAGGVRLPPVSMVRVARTDEELALGAAALQRALAALGAVRATLVGRTVAVDLASEQLFTGRADGSALDVARENLDEGIVFLARVHDG
jgi:hypothetical protein